MEGTPNNIKAQNFWNKLTGDPSDFSMENRAFNTISVITMLLLIIVLPINYFIHLPKVVVLIFIVLIIQTLFYYFSRFKKKFNLSVIAYAVFTYLTLIANFFLDSGTYGPTLIVFCLSFLLLIALTRKKTYWIWTSLHIIIVFALATFEYLHPELISGNFRSKDDRFFDFIFTYTVVIIFIFFVMSYFRNSYYAEKQLAIKKALDIEKQNLQILAQNQQLEYLNEEKNKLFSIISHDLRSPLNSIQGYLELLAEHDIDESDKEMMKRELLDLTKNTSDMLLNLLSWSKAQMQGVKVQLKPMNLDNTISQALEFQKSIAAKKGIQISYNNVQALDVVGDHDMLELVVRNLVNNSIKFTKPGGVISISVKRKGTEAELSIKDNGIGISEQQQKELFTLKSKSTYGTTNEKGMGLGLLLCKEFIELQNGKISFSSLPGLGSEFNITLPLFISAN